MQKNRRYNYTKRNFYNGYFIHQSRQFINVLSQLFLKLVYDDVLAYKSKVSQGTTLDPIKKVLTFTKLLKFIKIQYEFGKWVNKVRKMYRRESSVAGKIKLSLVLFSLIIKSFWQRILGEREKKL